MYCSRIVMVWQQVLYNWRLTTVSVVLKWRFVYVTFVRWDSEGCVGSSGKEHGCMTSCLVIMTSLVCVSGSLPLIYNHTHHLSIPILNAFLRHFKHLEMPMEEFINKWCTAILTMLCFNCKLLTVERSWTPEVGMYMFWEGLLIDSWIAM